MTQQEQQALEHFLNQLVQAPPVAKNPQADSLIQAALAKQPDAAYLLVQRAILLEQALEQAKAQISQLQGQGGGFLPRNNPWLAGGGAAQAVAAPAAPAAGPASSFLGNVATTAAGVVAGSFLFQGLEHLLHPGHGGWLADGGGIDRLDRETVAETTVINNYYGDAQPDAGMDTQLADFADDGEDARGDGDTWI